MPDQSKLELLRKQLAEAETTVLAALCEFRQFGSPDYERQWGTAVAKANQLADELAREESKTRKQPSPAT